MAGPHAGEVEGTLDDPGLLIYERVLPGLPSSVATIRREFMDALGGYDLTADRRADIALVVTEAATNAVVHGYRDTVPPGPLYAAAAVGTESLTVWVSDFGCGMQPHPDGSGLGLGMPLMGRLCDHVQITSDPDPPGTCVTATFVCRRPGRGRTHAPHTPTLASGRREILIDYLHALRVANSALREDTYALLGQAELAVARARRQRHQRAQHH